VFLPPLFAGVAVFCVWSHPAEGLCPWLGCCCFWASCCWRAFCPLGGLCCFWDINGLLGFFWTSTLLRGCWTSRLLRLLEHLRLACGLLDIHAVCGLLGHYRCCWVWDTSLAGDPAQYDYYRFSPYIIASSSRWIPNHKLSQCRLWIPISAPVLP